METTKQIPLRARKQAQTRLALVNAAIAQLDKGRNLDMVSVAELCAAADISEASFFNYFPRKIDLLVNFVQLWSLDLGWQVAQLPHTASAREAIELIFEGTAREVAAHPAVMLEIIAHQARVTERVSRELTAAERLVAFPDRAHILEIPAVGLDGLVPPLLARAVERGELPHRTDVQAAFLGITAIFFGVPLVLARVAPHAVASHYRQQLAVYWRGLSEQSKPPARKVRRRR